VHEALSNAILPIMQATSRRRNDSDPGPGVQREDNNTITITRIESLRL
jgi:hypothetical protein